MLTDIYITVPSQESFPEISVSSVAKNDRVEYMKKYHGDAKATIRQKQYIVASEDICGAKHHQTNLQQMLISEKSPDNG